MKYEKTHKTPDEHRFLVGNTMIDSLYMFLPKALEPLNIIYL